MYRSGETGGEVNAVLNHTTKQADSGGCQESGRLYFVGSGNCPEKAVSTFENIRKQLRDARAGYLNRACADERKSNAFMLGWVLAVQERMRDSRVRMTKELEKVDAAIKARRGGKERGGAEIAEDGAGLLRDDEEVLAATTGIGEGRLVDLP